MIYYVLKYRMSMSVLWYSTVYAASSMLGCSCARDGHAFLAVPSHTAGQSAPPGPRNPLRCNNKADMMHFRGMYRTYEIIT